MRDFSNFVLGVLLGIQSVKMRPAYLDAYLRGNELRHPLVGHMAALGLPLEEVDAAAAERQGDLHAFAAQHELVGERQEVRNDAGRADLAFVVSGSRLSSCVLTRASRAWRVGAPGADEVDGYVRHAGTLHIRRGCRPAGRIAWGSDARRWSFDYRTAFT